MASIFTTNIVTATAEAGAAGAPTEVFKSKSGNLEIANSSGTPPDNTVTMHAADKKVLVAVGAVS